MSGKETIKLLKDSEPLVFINEYLPPLAAGKYSVAADLTVNNNKSFDKAHKEFWVDAPRFILPQSDIYTVYPPRDATGRFETTLPHIVFNRRTLPWERTIDGEPAETTSFQNTKGHAPWMGLLLLNEDELNGHGNAADRVIVESKSLREIFITGKNGVFSPEIYNVGSSAGLALAEWEDLNSTCEVIEMPTSLFRTIVPPKEDLPLLAHVRQVVVNSHKEQADIDDGGYFSTIVCNRLPSRNRDISKSQKNTVFLVSLEGFRNYFLTPSHIKQNRVRLVVLSSWSFTTDKGKNFSELCSDLHVAPLKVNSPTSVTHGTVRSAYDYGYSLMPHTVRNGAKTFSWYRGPLNPNFLPANPKSQVFDSADEALRFDEETGLFDISYSAAWQLGRLLALKDKGFSNALYQWKMQDKRNLLKKAAKRETEALFPKSYTPGKTAEGEPLEELVKVFLEQKYDAESKKYLPVTKLSAGSGSLRELLHDIQHSDHENTTPAPKEVIDWLGKLFLLYGVPINYLVPNEHYLINYQKGAASKEVLGTFYFDYAWIEALLGGALSIVSAKDSVSLINMLKDGRFLPGNLIDNRDVIRDGPVKEHEPIPMPPTIPGHITGFLLRSELVSGWKGIKIFPKDPDKKWMEAPLRIERIAEDIKLCIFSGKVQEIYLIQPPEGIHFGISRGANANLFVKKMRSADGTINDNKEVTVEFRDPSKGVINLVRTAAGMQAKDGKDMYSSADFAFQMLEGPVMFILKINDK